MPKSEASEAELPIVPKSFNIRSERAHGGCLMVVFRTKLDHRLSLEELTTTLSAVDYLP